jgi:hypothetical protein
MFSKLEENTEELEKNKVTAEYIDHAQRLMGNLLRLTLYDDALKLWPYISKHVEIPMEIPRLINKILGNLPKEHIKKAITAEQCHQITTAIINNPQLIEPKALENFIRSSYAYLPPVGLEPLFRICNKADLMDTEMVEQMLKMLMTIEQRHEIKKSIDLLETWCSAEVTIQSLKAWNVTLLRFCVRENADLEYASKIYKYLKFKGIQPDIELSIFSNN